uniref:Uncharacterized protein n=1 Tax=Daphnia galeata TaxID=27404 RepID=A0A8J2RP29_9CRUS|nr:unnamed protein product [Daphnia galeata]
MASSMGLSGGRYLDPHSDSGFHYKYFPMDTEYTLILLGASKVLRTRSEMKSASNSKRLCFEARGCLFE